MHEWLRLGIAKPYVELDNLRTVGSHHQASVEKSREAGGANRGFDDGVENSLTVGGGHDPAVAVGAHASGVGAPIAVVNGLVILGGFEWNHMAAVAEHDEADFLAAQKLFDHQARAK